VQALEAPITKLQIPNKSQISISKFQNKSFGHWLLDIRLYLVIVFWNLEFPALALSTGLHRVGFAKIRLSPIGSNCSCRSDFYLLCQDKLEVEPPTNSDCGPTSKRRVSKSLNGQHQSAFHLWPMLRIGNSKLHKFTKYQTWNFVVLPF